MDNSECFGLKFVKIYPEMTSEYFFEKIWFWLIIGIFLHAPILLTTYCRFYFIKLIENFDDYKLLSITRKNVINYTITITPCWVFYFSLYVHLLLCEHLHLEGTSLWK
jgi:hypothetical protein